MKLPRNEIINLASVLLCAVIVFTAAGRIERNNPSKEVLLAGEMHRQRDNAWLSGYKVLQRWQMPKELLEISSNLLIDEIRMACIQDNKGIIYIYNLKTKAVEDKIEFEEEGDFEGLARVGDVYYVLRSDGMLFEISGGSKRTVKKYDLPLGPENDCESMFYDKSKNRLLIGVKEKDLSSKDKKGIYGFDLARKRMDSRAVYLIGNYAPGSDKKSDGKGSKNKTKGEIKPSEIVIHPQRGTLFILNGPSSQLMEADFAGNILSTIQFDKNDFPQPEGMCFSSSGKLYISSEGDKKHPGVIAQIELL